MLLKVGPCGWPWDPKPTLLLLIRNANFGTPPETYSEETLGWAQQSDLAGSPGDSDAQSTLRTTNLSHWCGRKTKQGMRAWNSLSET